jgi:FAD/FMN-containing dehydrogenase
MTLDPRAVQQFRQTHRGDVISPGDARYDQARRVWNAMIDKRPAIIARPRGSEDVVGCVRFARENNLPLAIRGGR